MAKVLTLLGTRPEIIKLSPLIPLLGEQFEHVLVHSGQHYSYEMDALFFEELRLPSPDYSLNVGSAQHGEQTARMLMQLEPILLREQPDAVLVQGDTNTTLSGALAAAKLHIPVVHVEAGCRSFNRSMPEELNRVLVDHMASLLFAPNEESLQNLHNEGIPAAQTYVVGSTAIDACERNQRYASESRLLAHLELEPGTYLALTLHRAENTEPDVLPGILDALDELSATHTIVFPMHPRTAAALHKQGLAMPSRIRCISPLGYIDMLRLVGGAQAVLTDSGGLQEEAAALRTPALVLRQETEWRDLVDAGIHTLVGNRRESILAGAAEALRPDRLRFARTRPLTLRRGASAQICAILATFLGLTNQPLREREVALGAAIA